MRLIPPVWQQQPGFGAYQPYDSNAETLYIKTRAEADAQALITRTRAQIEADRMLREYRLQTQEEDSRRARRSLPQSAGLGYVAPDKSMADLPPSSSDSRWDASARSCAKHLREIVADRAPSKAMGARLWGRMMEMPVGDDKLPLHVYLLLKYKPWTYWTEAGFLFHPSAIAHINKELDNYSLEDHLKALLSS